MKKDRFVDILNNTLGATFEALSYRFCDDCFFLNRSDGFRDLVSFDFDGDKSFRIFVGVDYPYDQTFDASTPPEGARLCRYFTGGSLSESPKDIFFKNEQQLTQHLERFREFFVSTIKPIFFDAVRTPEDYADSLPDAECIVKYEIYKKEKVNHKAVREAKIVIDTYQHMLDIKKIKDFIDNDVKIFLSSNRGK